MSANGPPPGELIARARSGDRQAFEALIARYDRYLRLVISGSMGPALRREFDTSDVLHETLLVALARFTNFHGTDERELVGWLRALASRKLVDLARRTGRQKRAPRGRLSLDEPQADDRQTLAAQLPGDLTSPSMAAAKREMAQKLAQALAAIEPREAEVLRLHHVEGMSFEAIGTQLGIGRNGVRGIWARGLRSLRRVLPSSGSGRLF